MSKIDILPRVIVAGSHFRINDYATFRHHLLEYLNGTFYGEPVEIVTGYNVTGVEDMAYHFARWDVNLPYIRMASKLTASADEMELDKATIMAEYAKSKGVSGHLIYIADSHDKKTNHIITESKRLGLDCKIIITDMSNFDIELFNF